MQTSLISPTPYFRAALINERLWRFEMEVYLLWEELEAENERFRSDGVELHFYLWSEVCDA